jgi:epoxyqueuosine reductase
MAGLAPDQSWGSWDLPLASKKQATCGRCTRCLDACPTDAFLGPFHLDPLRCISYWTIEARSPIPAALRPHFGNRIFGCDICQEVCPWNSRLPERSPLLAGLAAQAERIAPPLLDGFRAESPYWLEDGAFAQRFRRSPVKRAKRAGMLRNVCVALGNWGDPAALPALAQALNDPAALARQHAAWAVGEILRRHQLPAAQDLLTARLTTETDPSVRGELAAPLSHLPPL